MLAVLADARIDTVEVTFNGYADEGPSVSGVEEAGRKPLSGKRRAKPRSAVVAIGWLAFSFAVFALPAFIGVNIGIWAYQAGTGLLVAGILGLLAAAATFLIGHLILVFIRPLWAKLLVATAFAAPAAVAGYALTHGIVKHLIPADGWQIALPIVGAITVAVAALMQLASATDDSATSVGFNDTIKSLSQRTDSNLEATSSSSFQ